MAGKYSRLAAYKITEKGIWNMRKVLFIISLFLILPININCKALSAKDYIGEIVMGNPNIIDTDYSTGILIYPPKNNNYLYLAKGKNYADVSFSKSKDKILGIRGDWSIVEYNIKEKKTITIFEGTSDEASYTDVKYVPKTNDISFISVGLYIVNRITKKKIFIVDFYGDYAWSKDGEKLYYSDDTTIYCMDMKSTTIEVIGKGFNPQLSIDNDYMAFKTVRGELIVKEIKTGKKYKYKTTVKIDYYKFSPDAQQIAIIQGNTSPKYFYGQELIVWNFKNNKKETLIKHISPGYGTNFDWK
jgi:hypothetical protein